MFEASVDGKPYDADRWGAYFRPAGLAAPQGSSTSSTPVEEQAAPAAKAVAPVSSFDEEDDVPSATAPVEAKPAQKAEDILAMIRARQAKQ
jgi:hypothetical protein